DTNVFNNADSENPQKDFTVTVTPQTQVWVRAARTWIASTIKEDIVYYKKFSSERSADNSYLVGWLVPLTRITFSVSGNWVSTRDRPGFEIDTRAHRNESAVGGTVEIQGLSKTYFGFQGERREIKFDTGTEYLGTDLHTELSRIDSVGTAT